MSELLYICGAARTAIGNYNGALSHISAVETGALVIREALARAGVSSELVDECYMGCVLTGGLGQAPARQAWIGAGGSISVPCTTVGKVCGSGMQAVITASRAIRLGEFRLAVAGGMENMSAAGRLLPAGCVSTDDAVDVMVKDGLWDVYSNQHMGTICDRLAVSEGISRDAQDQFAILSYRRAIAATQDGRSRREIIPVETIASDGSAVKFEIDEGPRSFREDKIPHIRPAFVKDGTGTITAANASSINDGAAALVLADERAVRELNLTPLARVVSWGSGAVAPERFPFGPTVALRRALDAGNLKVEDIDCWEINEAFSAVTLLVMKELGLSVDKVNLLGGAVAIGHPIGASGARVLVTLLNVLNLEQKRYGAASLCIGGGEGIAMILERV